MMTTLDKSDLRFSVEETKQKIPKLIWQTAKSIPHKNSAPLIKSFIELNKDYTWLFMDDVRCDKFIKDNFNSEFYSMYASLPYGIMKADVWRVAVVYCYGGLYVDTDCECLKPLNALIKPTDSLVVGEEHDNGDLFNCVFAAEPKHPALLNVLNTFMNSYNNKSFENDTTESRIQNFGQWGFSYGVLEYCKNNPSDLRIIKHQENILTTSVKYNQTCIMHSAASVVWGSDYNSWRAHI